MKKLIYVVHQHHASHLHWDLRLEHEGVLKSWAIPKTPPRKKGIKRLVIQVEDHKLSYASFEGEIPQGQYGAGTVKIWDKGTYEILDKNSEKWEVKFTGKKFNGEFVLIKFPKSGPKAWLFFKK